MDLAMYVSAVESLQNDASGNSAIKQSSVKDLADAVAMEAIEWASQQVGNASSRSASGRNGVSYQSANGTQLFSPSKALFSPPKQPIPRNTSVFGVSSHLQSPPGTDSAQTQAQNAYARSLSLPQPISDQFANGMWPSYYASPSSRLNSTPFGTYGVPPPPAHTTPSNHATPFISPTAKLTNGHLGTSLSSGLLVSSSCASQQTSRVSPQFVSPHSLVLLGESCYSSQGQRFADNQLSQLDAFTAFSKPSSMMNNDGTSEQLGDVNVNNASNHQHAHPQFGNLPFLVSSPSVKNSNNVTITLNINNQIYSQNAAEYESMTSNCPSSASAFVNSLRDDTACSQQNAMGQSSTPNLLTMNPSLLVAAGGQSGAGPVDSSRSQNCFSSNRADVSVEQRAGASASTGRNSKRVIPVPKLHKTDEFDDDFELPSAGHTGGDLTRVERKRYRNRVAARKCRARKMQRIVELEDRARALREEIAAIQERSRGADEQVRALRARISEHAVNGCTIECEAETDADRVASEREVKCEVTTAGLNSNATATTQPVPVPVDVNVNVNVNRRADRLGAQCGVKRCAGDQTLMNDAASSSASYANDALSNASHTPDSVKSSAPSFSDTHAESLKQEDMKLLI